MTRRRTTRRTSRCASPTTGRACPPRWARTIFDPFFTTRPVGEGAGPGLTQVHFIARDHGGAVVLEPSPRARVRGAAAGARAADGPAGAAALAALGRGAGRDRGGAGAGHLAGRPRPRALERGLAGGECTRCGRRARRRFDGPHGEGAAVLGTARAGAAAGGPARGAERDRGPGPLARGPRHRRAVPGCVQPGLGGRVAGARGPAAPARLAAGAVARRSRGGGAAGPCLPVRVRAAGGDGRLARSTCGAPARCSRTG